MTSTLPDLDAVRAIILEFAQPLEPRLAPALTSQLGAVIAEDVVSDIDMPALATSRMDGYALRVSDAIGGNVVPVCGFAQAGMPAGALPENTGCFQIATGAPVPAGADCVIPLEETRRVAGGIEILWEKGESGKFIRNAGEEFRRGMVLVKTGTPLGPVEYGLLALAGRTAVKQFGIPRVAVVSTGDEVIEPGLKPASHQIRNSNGPMLMAQLCGAGAFPRFLGIAPDHSVGLGSYIREGSTHDAMVLTGGASKGECDVVRTTLISEGYEILVPGVMMRPGKPFFFARHPSGKMAFGLPGNPVSSFVCMEMFVRPAIRQMLGYPREIRFSREKGFMELPFAWKGDRPFVAPMRKTPDGGMVACSMVGSSDLLSVAGVNSLALLGPAGALQAGDAVEYLPVEHPHG